MHSQLRNRPPPRRSFETSTLPPLTSILHALHAKKQALFYVRWGFKSYLVVYLAWLRQCMETCLLMHTNKAPWELHVSRMKAGPTNYYRLWRSPHYSWMATWVDSMTMKYVHYISCPLTNSWCSLLFIHSGCTWQFGWMYSPGIMRRNYCSSLEYSHVPLFIPILFHKNY